MKIKAFTILACLMFVIISNQSIKIQQYSTCPHRKDCYTQGLFFLNDTHIFQSCGLYDQSFYHVLKYVQRGSSFSLQQTYKSEIPFNADIFGEGATFFKKTNFIYLMTWRQHQVFKISPETFQIVQTLTWQKQGWGLTSNDTHMFLTDGSYNVYLVDQNFRIIDQKSIKDLKGNKVSNLNELQLVVQGSKQYLYINVYFQRRILKVDFENGGKTVRQIDTLNLIQNEQGLKHGQVINGIAFNKIKGNFILTGKNWANFYQLSLS